MDIGIGIGIVCGICMGIDIGGGACGIDIDMGGLKLPCPMESEKLG